MQEVGQNFFIWSTFSSALPLTRPLFRPLEPPLACYRKNFHRDSQLVSKHVLPWFFVRFRLFQVSKMYITAIFCRKTRPLLSLPVIKVSSRRSFTFPASKDSNVEWQISAKEEKGLIQYALYVHHDWPMDSEFPARPPSKISSLLQGWSSPLELPLIKSQTGFVNRLCIPWHLVSPAALLRWCTAQHRDMIKTGLELSSVPHLDSRMWWLLLGH